MKMILRMVWFGFVVTTLLSSSAMGAAFIKFDGVDGESTDANHTNWSDVLEFDQGYLLQTFIDEKMKELPTEAVQVNDFVVTMELDKAGPKIAEALLKGKTFPSVQVELTATYGGSRTTYYKYDLSNVRVTGYQLNASGNDEMGPPRQAVSLSFTGVTVTYTEYDDTGSSQGNVEYSYEL